MEHRFAWSLGFCLIGTAGCLGLPPATEMFRKPDSGGIKRAAFELACPEEQLHITDLGDYTIGVDGCNKRAVYKLAYGAGWVNNSGSEDAQSRAAAK